MKTETLTVHEALAELKMLDKRITEKILNGKFSLAKRHSSNKITGLALNDFIDQENANYCAIIDLINRRKAIRNALSNSNAATKVMIGGKEYTVAEAIEMKKTGINNLRNLVNKMSEQLTAASFSVDRENDQLLKKADDYVIGLVGSKERAVTNEAITIRQAYIDANTYDLVTIQGLQEKIKALSDEIETFMSEVDSKISISNALTTITFEY